jgi:glycosyltransferase involved in cell wall biosynthesis
MTHLVEAGHTNWTATFVGDGPLAPEIQDWASRHPAISISCVQHADKEKLADLYAAADCFVLPTLDDNWSLVTLEAAVSGLPQVFSTLNGASSDLISRGCRGQLVDPRDTLGLARALMNRIHDIAPPAAPEKVSALVAEYSPASQARRAQLSLLRAAGSQEAPCVI